MCLKPTTEMAEPHAEGELQDQLADLEAQLQQIDDALEATGGADPELKTVRVELLESAEACRAALQPATVSAVADHSRITESSSVRIGGTYRFRYVDQRQHIGLVTALLRGDQAEVHFLQPTSAAMLAGVQLPASALQPAAFRQDDVSSLPPGSRVLAQLQGPADGGVWHESQIVDFTAGGRQVTVRSAENGATVTLPLAEVAAAHTAVSDGAGDEADAEFEDGDDDAEDEEDEDAVEVHRNAHAAFAAPEDIQQDAEEEATPSPEAVERLQAALQDDAQAVQKAVRAGNWRGQMLAAFEQHTRGIGSKLLAAMGFVVGRGLGRDGEGIVAPVDVQPRRPGAGLGLVSEEGMRAGARKKRRGGERARRRKHAEAARARKESARDKVAVAEAQDGVPQLFSFLNRAVGDGSDAAAARRRSSGEDKNRGYTVRAAPTAAAAAAGDSRGSLAAQQDVLTALRRQVVQLQGMAARNAKDKVLSQQISRRLTAATAQLAARESEHASSRKAISAKETQKRWTKF